MQFSRWLWAGLLAVTACSSPAAVPHGAHGGPVVVTIVIDQLAAWIARERWPELPASGGFARLRREGAWVTSLRYEHAVTDTAPGHSALYTGAVPRVSGIFANETLTVDAKVVTIVQDASTHLVTSDGETDLPGASLRALAVETLADRLRAEHTDALIYGLSLKDRGAIFGAGRSPDAAIWFSTKLNRFVTSTAFAHSLPRWSVPVVSRVAAEEARTWDLLDGAWVAAHAATPDREAGEGDVGGLGIVFPHALAASKTPSLAFRTSPFADEMLVHLGEAALDATAPGEPRPTLLTISLSSNDYIGHTFGPDSWEAWDELLHLDALLGRFLTWLDQRFGPEGYALLLTGDHGMSALPEAGRPRRCESAAPDPWDRGCEPSDRVMADALGEYLEARAREALGPGNWIKGVSDPYVYLTAAARQLDASKQDALRHAVMDALKGYPHVAEAYVVADLPATCPPFSDESVPALVCRSAAPGAGDFYVVLRRGSFFDPSIVVGKGASHGSPYLYDRTVPLLVRAPGRVAPGVIDDPLPFTTFVRTAAALLGISAPGQAGPGESLTVRRR